jgi:ATP-binding cassette, subfamily B, multidrug efflux pump
MAIQEEEVLGKAYDSRLMKRLLGYLRPYRGHVIFALSAIILKAACDVLGPYLIKVALDKYLSPAAGTHSLLDRVLSSRPLAGIAEIGAIYIGLLMFSFVLDFVQTYYMQWTGQMVMFDLRSQIYRHLQRMHLGFFDRNPVGRLVTRVTTDVDALNEMFTAGVVSIFEDVFVLAGIIAIMLFLDWKLALIALSVLPLIAWATRLFRDAVRSAYRKIRIAIARINSYMQEHVTGIVVLQLFNREKRAYDKFTVTNKQHMDAFKDAIWAHAVYYPIVELLSTVAIALVFWFGGEQIMHSAIFKSVTWSHGVQVVLSTATVGILVAFMQYAQRFFRPIQDLSEKYNILQSAMASAERVFKLLDTKPEITQPENPIKPQGPGRIEFDHVWFAYREMPEQTRGEQKSAASITEERSSAENVASAGRSPSMEDAALSEKSNGNSGSGAPAHALGEHPAPGDSGDHGNSGDAYDWVLRDVSLTIEPGETVAIVGHTGAGKTTIISLLLRFYDVQQGAIRIDGVDLRQMDLTELRRRFGVVLQDPFLFSGTVENNIRLGTDWITNEQVERAAEDVNIAEFIRTLPQGFGEQVRERGSTLSTGQKQLISFARALAHNPQFLILDEATSSVDTETEFRVREALSRMVEGRTSIIIAHRLSTVQRADKIVVMHKGKVREVGSHQELLARRGIYWKLYQLQYKDQELPLPPAAGESPRQPVGADD